jgi:cytochrome c peroxidase
MGDSFDAHDPACMTEAAVRGARLFVGKASCNECHNGPMLSDGTLHLLGIGTGATELDDDGLREKYQTGPLRQIAQTAPYMHDGSLASLWEVLEFYRAGGDASTGDARDRKLAPLDLDDPEMLAMEAFLLALDGAPLDYCWVNDDPACCDDDGGWLPEPDDANCTHDPDAVVARACE